MTAVIGILNKRGVAIAADSACTITKCSNRKIVTTANKMLRLCDNTFISVMIAGNALFRSTPWDIIIRRFRQTNKQEMPTVRDAATMFLDYVRGNDVFNSTKTIGHTSLASTTLVFSGFGTMEDYPTLIALEVFPRKDMSLFTLKKCDISISSETPAAICPFAQTDTMNGILSGINSEVENEIRSGASFKTCFERLRRDCKYDQYDDFSGINTLSEEFAGKLDRGVWDMVEQEKEKVRQKWEKAVVQFSLHDMAILAENLVSVTAFDRLMKFKDEGVGGPIDLAIIDKVNGFTWLNRKSWYDHLDVGGQYGRLGV